MCLPLVPSFVEDLVGLVAGQALVPKVDGQAGQLTQLFGELSILLCLRACFSGEMFGVAHNNARYSEPAAEPRQRAQIFTPAAAPFEREHRLRRQAQFVRDGHADSSIADIEAEIAGNTQLLAPSF